MHSLEAIINVSIIKYVCSRRIILKNNSEFHSPFKPNMFTRILNFLEGKTEGNQQWFMVNKE